MVAVALGEHEREEEVVLHLAVVDGIARDVRHEPVPKLGERPGNRTGKHEFKTIRLLDQRGRGENGGRVANTSTMEG